MSQPIIVLMLAGVGRSVHGCFRHSAQISSLSHLRINVNYTWYVFVFGWRRRPGPDDAGEGGHEKGEGEGEDDDGLTQLEIKFKGFPAGMSGSGCP